MFRPTRAQRQVLLVIVGPMKLAEIQAALGLKKSTAWGRCNGMVKRGLLKKLSHGRYWFARPDLHGTED